MLGLIAGVALGAAGALAYANRASLIKDVHTRYEDVITDLGAIEAKLTSTAQIAAAASNAHATLASENATTAHKASALASSISAMTGSKTG